MPPRAGSIARRSYNLAVWEGKRPKTNAAANKTFEALFAQYQEAEKPPKPTPAMFGQATVASAFAAKLAKEHGLVCFDPQSNKLR